MDTANPYPSGGLSLWSTKREQADQKREQLNLSHITGVAVCTVSDDESTVHRASVKLTWTTWSSRCTPWFPGASLLAHAPRGSPDVVGGPWHRICNLTAPLVLGSWTIRNQFSIGAED